MKILGLQLLTHQLQAQVEFYQQFLQLPLVEARDNYMAFQAGATKLVFAPAERDTTPNYYLAFAIPDEQLERVEKHADESGISITHAFDAVYPGGAQRGIYCRDAGGNLVGFVTFPRIHNVVTLSNGTNILNVAEIGLAVDDISVSVDQLTRRFGAQLYAQTAERAVVGDTGGLFRVVRRGESWFPAGTFTAETWPIIMTVTGQETATSRLYELPYYIHIAAS